MTTIPGLPSSGSSRVITVLFSVIFSPLNIISIIMLYYIKVVLILLTFIMLNLRAALPFLTLIILKRSSAVCPYRTNMYALYLFV